MRAFLAVERASISRSTVAPPVLAPSPVGKRKFANSREMGKMKVLYQAL
jgi:hypothetical protein